MFPTFISILDIQSWWEVPSIAHFCSLFRTAFNLLDFDIEDLEEALLTDGTEEPSWLQELIVLLLKGCLPKNEISIFNYQMFLRRLFRKKCQEHHGLENPFNTDVDFQLLPLRAKVDILHALCDFRLEARDVFDKLRHLEAASLRVEPLGHDANRSAYWYFYGTRLYREDKGERAVWQVVCFTLNDWTRLARRFERSGHGEERALFGTLNDNFLPELPRLFREKESLARKRLIERLPRRTSDRLRNKEEDKTEKIDGEEEELEEDLEELEKERLRLDRQGRFDNRTRYSTRSDREENSESEADSVDSREMVGTKSKDRKAKAKPVKESTTDNVRSRSSTRNATNNQDKAQNKQKSEVKPVGRQTNNSLASATGQILIQPMANPNRKKLKTSQVFSQTEEDLQTGLHKILDHVKNHEDAWPFIEPVEEEYAPNYYTIIRKPMDLQRMEERLDSGHYKSFSKFKTDFQLIVNNCRLYNGVDNEYSEMVETLLEVFNRSAERFLDQITSSDDEIAIEYPESDKDKAGKKKKNEPVITQSRRKPTLAAQTDKKKDRSPSSEEEIEDEEQQPEEEPYESEEEYVKPAKKSPKEKAKKSSKKDEDREKENLRSNKKRKGRFEEVDVKPSKRQKLVPEEKSSKEEPVETVSKNKKHKEPEKIEKKPEERKKNKKAEEKKEKVNKKTTEEKIKKSDEKIIKKPEEKINKKVEEKINKKVEEKINKKVEEKINKKVEEKSKKLDKKQAKSTVTGEVKKKPGRKPKKVSPSPERSPSMDRWSSSPPPSWPPSSPENRLEFSPKRKNKSFYSDEEENADNQGKQKDKNDKWKEIFKEDEQPTPPKHKDKHNKLRETIEKLKAKSDIGYMKEKEKPVVEKPKEIIEAKSDKNKKEKEPKKKPKKDFEEDNSTMDSVLSKGSKKVSEAKNNNSGTKNSTIEALTLATEQTLKDINKWLDDAPVQYSPGAADSPSHFSTGIDEFDGWNTKNEQDKKKVDKPPVIAPKKDLLPKDVRKRPFPKDQKPPVRRREVQRTIDRLQPGKSKGNLISNIPSAAKTDELFPMGALSKIKDTKNSLIVKTDESAPKLSLGTVLDSFGEHKFVDDEPVAAEKAVEVTEKVTEEEKVKDESGEVSKKEEVKKEETTADPMKLDNSPGKATPNLSAWFKAFGAPKVQPAVKKADAKEDKPDSEIKKEEPIKKIFPPDPSPNPDSPVMHGQPTQRQRKLSTGSSMSERSSFSQDMDSPRVGIDERIGAYPAPYPSPLHKSPSSPSLRSPLPDASPKSYPFNGQIRVGFYQDTVSTKSSPDKSCSPRDNPQSPHAQFSEHVYTPQTMQSPSYGNNSAYYTHPPNYSSSNPTPPYNLEHSPNPPSYYDTSKPLTDQYKGSVASPAGSPAEQQQPIKPQQQQQQQQQPQQQVPPASLDLFNQEGDEAFGGQSRQTSASTAMDAQFQQQTQQHLQDITPSLDKYRSTQEDFNKLTSNVDAYNQHSTTAPDPTENVDSYRSQQASLELLRQQQQQQQSQQQQQLQQLQQLQMQQQQLQQQLEQAAPAGNADAYRGEQPVREKMQQPSAVAFPVKKRAYSEIEQSARYDEQQYNRSNMDMALMSSRLPNEQVSTREPPKYVHQNIPEPPRSLATSQTTTQQTSQETNNPLTLRNSPFAPAASNHPFGYNDGFPINIPSAARSLPESERKVDMSKYVNVGYTGNDMAFTRNPQQYNKPELNYLKLSAAEQQSNSQHINIGSYKLPAQTSVTETSNSMSASRLQSFKPEVTVPKPTYSSEMEQSLALRGNIANLSHIVDRYPNEERLLSGLQTSAGSYYADKNLPSQHMFSKGMPPANSMSGLPTFSQPNSMPYGHGMQTASGVYNRQMGDLQNSSMLAQERNVPTATLQQQMQEKKTKKRKTKTATPPTSAIEQPTSNVPTQGFQSYSGLKESSAISLKTASVVPGSAFNFGPTAPGLGLGSGLYSDKDSYPNFCSAPNYYMAAAAAAHHRSTPESGEKTAAKPASNQQQQQPSSYPFMPGPQGRPPNYPLGAPFMAPHHQGLMDPNSPLYQQYLQQAGVLHQSLLGPPGAYPPGYHPALSMRQPYDSMTRPSWL